MVKHLKLLKLSLFIAFIFSNFVSPRLLDVQISLDTSEKNADQPISSAVGIGLCQNSTPILTTSHIFYNILKAREARNPNFSTIPIDQNWDIYKFKHSDEYFLFIPKEYKRYLLTLYNTPAFRDEISKLGLRDNIEEIILGFKIAPESNLLQPVTLAEYDTPAKIEAVKHNYYSIDLNHIFNIFVNGKESVHGLWNITLDGHGWYPSGLEPNLTMDTLLKTIEGGGSTIAGLKLSEFRKLIQFFINKINVNFFYYMTCFAGDLNLILPYITSLINPAGRIVGGLQKPNFTIAAGSLTSQSVYVNEKETLEICNRQADKLNIPKGFINYALFFKLLHQYSKPEAISATLFKDKELKEILNAITPRVKLSSFDPHGISGLPSVMFPQTNTFRAVALDETITIISNVLAKKYELENKSYIINDKQVILIYPQKITLPLKINVSSGKPVPSMVSMVPGLNLTMFENIESNINIYDFIKTLIGSTAPVFNKYFYIKKLKLQNSNIFKLLDYPTGSIELNDVLILLEGLEDQASINMIYTTPNLEIAEYKFFRGIPFEEKKLGALAKVKVFEHNDFLNSVYNYFYLIKQKNEARNAIRFESFKKILSKNDLKLLEENAPNILEELNKEFPNLLSNPNQLNSSGQLPLNIAAKNNDPALMDKLISIGANVNGKDINGDTPLIISAKNKSRYSFNFLIQNPNIDIFAEDNTGQNAIQIAKKSGDLELQKAIINKFLESWILFSYPNLLTDQNQLNDALYLNSNGNLNTTKILIFLGADINSVHDSWTLLHRAVYADKIDLVRFLLKNGANPQLKDKYGNDALYWARYKGNQDIINAIERVLSTSQAQTQSSVQSNRKFNQTINKINLFINLTSKIKKNKNEKKKKQLTKRLKNQRRNIINNFDLNIKNDKGQTPLMVRPDLIPFLKELPKWNARKIVNTKDNNGKKVLNYLIDSKYKLNMQFYRILINSGTKVTRDDIKQFNNSVKTKNQKFKKIVKLLRKNL